MPDRDRIAIYRTRLAMADLVRRKVGDDLVAVEVEVHPVRGTAALRTAKQITIKLPGSCNVVNRKGEMERGNGSSGIADGKARISVEWVVLDNTNKVCPCRRHRVRKKMSRHGRQFKGNENSLIMIVFLAQHQ
jgi:hypothetical protein